MTSLSPRIKDIATRAAKTFVQAGVAVIAAALATGTPADVAGWRAIGVAALAAGISAAWNAVVAALAVPTA